MSRCEAAKLYHYMKIKPGNTVQVTGAIEELGVYGATPMYLRTGIVTENPATNHGINNAGRVLRVEDSNGTSWLIKAEHVTVV